MEPDDTNSADVKEDVLFKALKADSTWAKYLPDAASTSVAELTSDDLAKGLGLTRAGTNLQTKDFEAFLDRLAKLEDIIDSADENATETGSQGISTALDSLVTAVEGIVADPDANSTGGSLVAAKNAAEGFRSNTLAYEAFAAMSALISALEASAAATGDGIDPAVTVAREALIAVHGLVTYYNADTQKRITEGYNNLIRDGSTSHVYAQQAALKVLLAALKGETSSTKLKTDIQDAIKNTQSRDEQQAQSMISKIEASISRVTVSSGDQVKLEVKLYGVQGIMDQKLINGADGIAGNEDDVTLEWEADSGDTGDGTGTTIMYTAPTAPGSYDVTASLDSNECYHADSATQTEKCSATITVKVRRPSPPQPADEPPVNPSTVPSILTDDSGNQYEVFTPVEGGTFDSGEGYSIAAQSGDVPNGEVIGVRMSDDGSAANTGKTHQRYTLGGNIYGIHVVDGMGSSINSYVLDAAAQVCLPLPDMLRSNISNVAIVVINDNDTLTVLSASAKIGATGTMVCGKISGLPASVAVGHVGSPAAIPTATPEPTPVPPPTGATAPASNGILVWAILLGLAITGAGTILAMARRRKNETPLAS